MDLNSIREALHRQPFKPFAIRLADGRTVPVGHPEFVAIGSRIIVVVAHDNSWSAIEPLLIVSIDYASADSAGPNGSGKKKGRPSSDK